MQPADFFAHREQPTADLPTLSSVQALEARITESVKLLPTDLDKKISWFSKFKLDLDTLELDANAILSRNKDTIVTSRCPTIATILYLFGCNRFAGKFGHVRASLQTVLSSVHALVKEVEVKELASLKKLNDSKTGCVVRIALLYQMIANLLPHSLPDEEGMTECLFRAQAYRIASDRFYKLTAAQPKKAELKIKTIEAAVCAGRYDRALTDINLLKSHHFPNKDSDYPYRLRLDLLRADCLIETGNYADARAILCEYLSDSKHNAEIKKKLYLLGVLEGVSLFQKNQWNWSDFVVNIEILHADLYPKDSKFWGKERVVLRFSCWLDVVMNIRKLYKDHLLLKQVVDHVIQDRIVCDNRQKIFDCFREKVLQLRQDTISCEETHAKMESNISLANELTHDVARPIKLAIRVNLIDRIYGSEKESGKTGLVERLKFLQQYDNYLQALERYTSKLPADELKFVSKKLKEIERKIEPIKSYVDHLTAIFPE